MRPLFSLQGGKAFQGKMLVEKFPTECTTYIEPFVGAGGVFFEKEKHQTEIINDKDSDTIFVFKMIQKLPEAPKLTGELCDTKEKFIKWKNLSPKTEIERLNKILILQKCSWRGNRDTYAPSRVGTINSTNFIKKWGKYHQRLKGVKIYNKDWKDIVQPYKNDSNAFIYLDPPYETTDSKNVTKASNDGNYYGKINLNELILFLNECKCKWMLSFSLNKELMKRMKGFNIKTYTTRKG